MSRRLNQQQLVARQEVVNAPIAATERACNDRSFELPPGLHIASAMLFVGFVSILCAALATPGLLVPYAVFVFFIAAFFAVPALWTRMKPAASRTRPMLWDQFLETGIDTFTGRTPAGEAAVLVLMMPFVVFIWAIAIAVITMVVR